METALQEAIKEIQDKLDQLSENMLKFGFTQISIGKRYAYKETLRYLKAKLPKEREQIEQAYHSGNEKSWSAAPKITAQEYYETNFNK
jgi:DNA-binding ferritin-like protein